MKKMPINTKNILWDHHAYGPPEFCHPTRKRNPSVILKDRTVGLASRILESMPKNDGIVLGSVNADKSSDGLVVTVDRFEEHQRQPKLMLPGDLQVPITFCKKSCLNKEKTVEDYFSDLKSLFRDCGERSEVDLSNVVKIELKCQLEGPRCCVQVEALMPSTTFKIVPIPPVPVAATALYNSLTSNNEQSLPRSGLITIDQYKKIVYILENDPRVSTTQLVGLWVSGIDVAHDPYVWAACLRYITCPAYVCRTCLPPKPFLLALCTTVNLKPEYYDCFAPSGIDFHLLNGRTSLTVTKVPSFGSRITVLELLVESDAQKLKSFSEAKLLFLKERNETVSCKNPVADIQSNVDDFPRMTPVAQQVQNMEFKPLVPDVSLLSEPGSGNTRLYGKENLADDYRVLLKKYPLQTINMNSQQILTNSGKLDQLINRNPSVHLNSKAIDSRSDRRSPNMHCNNENEPPVSTNVPMPHTFPDSAITNSNTHLSDAVFVGNTKYPHHSVTRRLAPPTQGSVPPRGISHLPLDTPKRFLRAPIGRPLQSVPQISRGVHNTDVDEISGNGNENANNCYSHYNQRTISGHRNDGGPSLPAVDFYRSSNFTENCCTDKAQENVQFIPSDHTVAHKIAAIDNSEVANNPPKNAIVSCPSQNFGTACGYSNQCSAERSSHMTNLQPTNFVSQSDQRRMPIDCQDSVSAHKENSDVTNIRGLSAELASNPKESGSFEMQKIIEEQDNKLRQLQEQIQLLLQAQTLEEKTEPERPSPVRKSQVLEDEEKLEVYKMLKHQDEQLQLLQAQIKTVLELHQPSPNNRRRSSDDSGLDASPVDNFQRPRCNVCVVTCGEPELLNEHPCEHQKNLEQTLPSIGVKSFLVDTYHRSRCNVGIVTCCGETEILSCESPKNGHCCQTQKNIERRSSNNRLELSPAETFYKSRCNVGVMANLCGETESSSHEMAKNGKHCEHQKRCTPVTGENCRERCAKCSGCSCGNHAALHNSPLMLKSFNIPTVSELPQSLPPSFQVDMKDYDTSSCLSETSREVVNNSPVLGESVSYFRDEQVTSRTGSPDEIYDDVERGDAFCKQLLGNINCLLEKERDGEKSGIYNEGERYGFDSFLLPKLNYQTFHLNNVDSDLGDLALKYLGHQQIKGTLSSTKVFLEHKRVQNETNPSDTTLYGLSPSNISFSTKMYLERHGLASSAGRPQVESESQSFWVFSDLRKLKKMPQGVINTDTSKILDLEALKRQPKLL